MKLQTILTPDCTRCAVPGSSKKRVLEAICELASTHITDTSQQELLDSLMAREQLGSTGIGNGIAIPHGRLNHSNNVVAVLVTTEQAIRFDAIDNKPVDIFFALFVPEADCQQHLSTLAGFAKFFGDRQNAKRIRKCTNDDELYAIITEDKG